MERPRGVELSKPSRDPTPPEDGIFGTPEDEIVYAVSHDLRGPLLNFQGFLRRLATACETLHDHTQRWELPAEQHAFCRELVEQKIRTSVRVLERNARRMDGQLAALLDLSRAGRDPLACRRVEANEIAQAALEELRTTVVEKAPVVRIDPLPELWADPDRLAVIYRQLLGNACKFLSPKRPGQITLGGRASGRETVCWVQDNGIGIKPPHQRRIFVPFGRLREIETPGEGVGLAICRKLMRQMAGKIWVESVHGEGSTFYLSFPAGPPAGGRTEPAA